MKISAKGRYALRMLIYLAEHKDKGYISLKEISAEQEVSKKYLEQIIPVFNNANILKTNRGAQGGYMLARSPKEYTMGEILRLTEGSLSPVDCDDTDLSDISAADRAVFPIWRELSRMINDYLDGITLEDIVEMQKENYANDYSI